MATDPRSAFEKERDKRREIDKQIKRDIEAIKRQQQKESLDKIKKIAKSRGNKKAVENIERVEREQGFTLQEGAKVTLEKDGKEYAGQVVQGKAIGVRTVTPQEQRERAAERSRVQARENLRDSSVTREQYRVQQGTATREEQALARQQEFERLGVVQLLPSPERSVSDFQRTRATPVLAAFATATGQKITLQGQNIKRKASSLPSEDENQIQTPYGYTPNYSGGDFVGAGRPQRKSDSLASDSRSNIFLSDLEKRDQRTQDRLTKLQKREERLQTFKQAIYERLRIAPESKKLSPLGVVKAVARQPFEFASAPVLIGGRIGAFAEGLTSKSGRKELLSASKEVPSSVVQSFNPKTSEGLANIITAVAPFAIKATGSVIKNAKSTNLVFDEYVNPVSGKSIFVGKGTYKGAAAESVILVGDDATKTIIRTPSKTIKTLETPTSSIIETFNRRGQLVSRTSRAPGPSIFDEIVIKNAAERNFQQMFKGQGAEVSRGLATEILEQDITAAGARGRLSAQLKSKRVDLVKTRIDTTPEVTTVVDDIGGVRTPRSVDFVEEIFEFGNEPLPKDSVILEPIDGGTRIISTRAPRIVQAGTRSQGGFGTLEIREIGSLERMNEVLGGLSRSKKAQAAVAVQKTAVVRKELATFNVFNEPLIRNFDTPTAKVTPIIPSISSFEAVNTTPQNTTVIGAVNDIVGNVAVKPAQSSVQRSSPTQVSVQSPLSVTSIISAPASAQRSRSVTKTESRTASVQKQENVFAQLQKQMQVQVQRQAQVQSQTRARSSPLLSLNLGFGIAGVPSVPFPLLQTGSKNVSRQPKGSKKKAQQAFTFAPTTRAVLFNLQGKTPKGNVLSGLGERFVQNIRGKKRK